MTYIPSSFIASLTPKKLDSGDQVLSHTNFHDVAQADSDLTLETNRFTVHLSKSSSTQVATSHDDQITLLLHGEIYTGGNSPANYLLERYLDEGIEFAKDVNGSFALLVVDKRTDQIILITDRLNTREVSFRNRRKDPTGRPFRLTHRWGAEKVVRQPESKFCPLAQATTPQVF